MCPASTSRFNDSSSRSHIRQVQARRRLVENVDRVLRALQLAQLSGDLDALRLAARKRRRRLAERQVAEPEIGEHLDLFAHARLAREERHAFFNRHVQHIVDRLAAQRHFERLAVESRALARAARDLDVGHEVQLRRDRAFALTFLATPALHVEAESARLVAALDR